MRKEVIIKLDVEGFHYYNNAPKKVSFLRENHRHTFKITAAYKVSHNNREKEIFIQREELRDYLTESYGSPCLFREMSCEMIAEDILLHCKEDGMIWCEVWEEETGGAKVSI